MSSSARLSFCAILFIRNAVTELTCNVRHILYLARRTNPLDPFFSRRDPPIPLDLLFTILHVAIHCNLLMILWSHRPFLQNVAGPYPATYTAMYATATAAPMLCLLMGRGSTNVIWWSFALASVCFQHLFHRSVADGHRSLSELESMKYDAKGA